MFGGLSSWLGENPWALWVILSVVLGIAEILSLNLVLVMTAVGALAGAAVGAIVPGMWWLQILVAVAVSIGMLVLLRPTLMERVRRMPGYRSSTDKMLGSSGIALSAVTRDSGEVKIDGQPWTARAYMPGTVIDEGTEVEVFELDGPIIKVYPKYGELPHA